MKISSVFILLPVLASADPSTISTTSKTERVLSVTDPSKEAAEAIPIQTDKGTLGDQRDYTANLRFTRAEAGRMALAALELKIAEVPVSVPQEALSDLQMPMPVPVPMSVKSASNETSEAKPSGVTITGFDGETRIMIEGFLGDCGGVAILTVKKDETWVSSREFVWFESGASPDGGPAKRSDVRNFPPPPVALVSAAIPVPTAELKIEAVGK